MRKGPGIADLVQAVLARAVRVVNRQGGLHWPPLPIY